LLGIKLIKFTNNIHIKGDFMRATGIVRRIDDLGRVVIPKEIRKRSRNSAPFCRYSFSNFAPQCQQQIRLPGCSKLHFEQIIVPFSVVEKVVVSVQFSFSSLDVSLALEIVGSLAIMDFTLPSDSSVI
jgi:hypothetical protein